MQLVFFRFQIVKELADGVDDEGPFVSGEVAERSRPHTARSRRFFEIVEVGTVARLCPWLDGAFIQGLVLVGDDQIEIEIDRVTEALTSGARTERTVE